MSEHEWIKEFPAAITVCDASGILLEMNDRAAKTYAKDGGYELLGKNMLDCHPEVGAEQSGTACSLPMRRTFTPSKRTA